MLVGNGVSCFSAKLVYFSCISSYSIVRKFHRRIIKPLAGAMSCIKCTSEVQRCGICTLQIECIALSHVERIRLPYSSENSVVGNIVPKVYTFKRYWSGLKWDHDEKKMIQINVILVLKFFKIEKLFA